MKERALTAEKACTRCKQVKPLVRWRSICKECKREQDKEWKRANPGKHYAATKRWRKKDPQHFKSLDRHYREKQRLLAIEALGGHCKDCDTSDSLHIHHIHGNGADDRKNGFENDTFHRWIGKHVAEAVHLFELLCRKCHKRKHAKT